VTEFVPSLRFHFLTPFYDFLFGILLPEKKLRQTMIDMVEKLNPQNIIELGCSTGGLTLPLAKKFTTVPVYAVDADKKALSILERKLNKISQNKITLTHASSSLLPFENKSAHTVIASLLFCNLLPDEKLKTLHEINRILTNEGHLIIMDWGKPKTILSTIGFFILQTVGGRKTTDDLKKGIFTNLLKQNQFIIQKKESTTTLFGTLYFYQCNMQKGNSIVR